MKASTVDKYICQSPEQYQELLQQIREQILKNAPDATELISYSMPAYKLGGMLLYFALNKNHIGVYPTA